MIIGEKINSPESYLDNLPATVYFRMPLILQLRPSGGKANNPRKPGEPHEPRPEGPNPAEPPPATSNPGAGEVVPGTKPIQETPYLS